MRTRMRTQEYDDYINKSPEWQELRYRVLVLRAGDRCEKMTPDGRCTARATHCHHLTYVRLFHERLEDLQALCEAHHRAEHVWEDNPRCRYCPRRVFADMDEVLGFVEANEDLTWDELDADLPAACARCVDARYQAALLRHNGRAVHPNGHSQLTSNTRTPMATNHKANSIAPTIALPIDDDLDDLDDPDDPDEQPEVPPKAKAKAKAKVTIKWKRDEALEEMMAETGAVWEYRANVPLADVDVAKSRENTTRLGEPIVQSYLDTMVIRARRAGRAILPALLAWYPRAEGLLVLLDGNHRDQAARDLDQTHADMYVLVDPGSATVKEVQRAANLLVGKGSTAEEKVQNAAHHYWEHKKTGCSITEAADKQGVKRGTLTDFVHAAEMARDLSADGETPVKDAAKLNAAARCQLWKIRNTKARWHAAQRLAMFPKPTSKNAERVWRAYKAAPATQEEQLAAVDAECDLMASELAEDASRKGPAAQHKLRRLLRRDNLSMKGFFPPDVDPKDVVPDPKVRAAILVELDERDFMSLRIREGFA
jgi:hypothetical protein